jgi:hypothetical protein
MLRDTRVCVCGFVLLAIRLNRCVARGISPTIFFLHSRRSKRGEGNPKGGGPRATQGKDKGKPKGKRPKGNTRERQGKTQGKPQGGRPKGNTRERQGKTQGKSLLMVKLWRRRTACRSFRLFSLVTALFPMSLQVPIKRLNGPKLPCCGACKGKFAITREKVGFPRGVGSSAEFPLFSLVFGGFPLWSASSHQILKRA